MYKTKSNKATSVRIWTAIGLVYLQNFLNKISYKGLIDLAVGDVHAKSQYTIGDTVLAYLYILFSGFDRLEHIKHVKAGIPDEVFAGLIPSPDRISGRQRDMAVGTHIYTNGAVKHEYNYNERLVKMSFASLRQLNLISADSDIILADFDHTIAQHAINDGKVTYKTSIKGYQPGLGALNGIPVFVWGANGNTNATYKQATILFEFISLAKENGYPITHFRADHASSSDDCLKLFHAGDITFYTRAGANRVKSGILDDVEWKPGIIHRYGRPRKLQIADFERRLTDKKIKVRFVALQEPNGKRFTLITNDFEKSPTEIIEYYNNRGSFERTISQLKQSFGWGKLNHRNLSENTVQLILGVMAYQVFTGLKRDMIQKRLPGVSEQMTLPTLINSHINIPGLVVGNKIVSIHRPNPYQPAIAA